MGAGLRAAPWALKFPCAVRIPRSIIAFHEFCAVRQNDAERLVFQIVFQLLRPGGMTQLGKRLRLDLANTLTCYAKFATNFLERTRMPVFQAETQGNNLALT